MDTKNSLYEGLTSEIRSERFSRQFQLLTEEKVELQKYFSPEQLIGTLRTKEGGGYDEKDKILHTLIDVTQNGTGLEGVAITMLLVALWPAIDHVFYKLLPLSKHFTDLFSEIYWAFIEEVQRFNLQKRSKIAANLQWNTEKRVRRVPKNEERYQHFIQAYAILDLDEGSRSTYLIHNNPTHPLNLLSEEKKNRLQTYLRRIPKPHSTNNFDESEKAAAKGIISSLKEWEVINDDDESLLISHAIDHEDLCEIAERLGMKPGTARVKYFRAKEKVRCHLQPR